MKWHFALSTAITAVAVLVIGFYVLMKNPKGRVNRVWASYNCAIAVWAIGQTAVVLTTSSRAATILSRLYFGFGVFWIASFLLHLVFELIGEQQSYRRPLLVAYSFSAVCLVWAPSPWLLGNARLHPGIGYYAAPGPLFGWFLCGWIALVVYSLSIVVWKIRTSEDDLKRHQLKCFLGFAAVGYAGGVSNFLPMFNVTLWPYTPYGTYAVPIYTLMATYAIIRYQLLDISVVISRRVAYSLLVGSLTITFLLTIVLIEGSLRGILGYQSLVVTVIVSALVAVFLNPLRERVQAFVDRSLFDATPTELAEQRERLLEELGKTDQAKAVATLAAGLAHEIRNPLSVIKTFTEHIDADREDPEFQRKLKRIVGGEVERINLIAQRLLDFAKPSAPQLAPVSVPQLLDETLEFLNGELIQRGVQVVRRYDDSSPVLGDAKQLKQVFLNLLLNSLQAVNGHGQFTISITRSDNRLEIQIADNGCGIAAKDVDKVFDPFFTTKPTGSGLGLSVVRQIVNDHAGQVTVESVFDQGTTVTLVLPTAG